MGAPPCIAPLLCGLCVQAKYADKGTCIIKGPPASTYIVCKGHSLASFHHFNPLRPVEDAPYLRQIGPLSPESLRRCGRARCDRDPFRPPLCPLYYPFMPPT
eukprot:7664761-Pyramimonas_sp.AAC.1